MTGTTRVDFYQLSRDPVDVTVAKLARKVLQAGERLVVVSAEAAQREHLSKILWEQGGAAFLAHGMAEAPQAARQPNLVADGIDAPNGAPMARIADGP
ncbi:MAG: DNA polymerase III subunit chi, partial [Pseudomonadota bacterium]|nr:DNA polymerase III subunit chi [Pseudomonadota bacterium]